LGPAAAGSVGAASSRDRGVPEAVPDQRAPWDRPSASALARLQYSARTGGNLFGELLQTVCSCTLGQITHALYDVGGQYRRSM
jgi:methylmalonyl-CoA mutase